MITRMFLRSIYVTCIILLLDSAGLRCSHGCVWSISSASFHTAALSYFKALVHIKEVMMGGYNCKCLVIIIVSTTVNLYKKIVAAI